VNQKHDLFGISRTNLLVDLGHPTHSPHASPIPGLADIGENDGAQHPGDVVGLMKSA
jgi:hypothetical protein